MMACLLSRFLPSRTASRHFFTVLGGRPAPQCTDCTDQSLHFSARHERITHSVLDPVTPSSVPESLSRLLRVDNIALCESPDDLDDIFLESEGYRGCNLTTYLHRPTQQTVKIGTIVFDTADNASKAAEQVNGTLLDGLPISLSSVVFDLLIAEIRSSDLEGVSGYARWLPDVDTVERNWLTMGADEMKSPPRKKAKLDVPIKVVCKICTSESSGTYSKPCLRCKQAWCLDCVKTWFTQASNDFERMPARCCNMVMHHGVAGGTLSPVEYDLYKLRYDERTTPNPLYCPMPTCSTFIPPRLLDSSKTTVTCTICTTQICTTCKQVAESDHKCEDNVTMAKIKSLKYKTCPKCGTGVQRMYGCPHVRCACGAHFCWDCMRAISICYRSPCASAREDGQYSEEDEGFSDSEDEIGQGLTPAQLAQLSQNQNIGADHRRNTQNTSTENPSIMQRMFSMVQTVRRRHSEPQAASRADPSQEIHRYPSESGSLVPGAPTLSQLAQAGRLPAPQQESSDEILSGPAGPDASPAFLSATTAVQYEPHEEISSSSIQDPIGTMAAAEAMIALRRPSNALTLADALLQARTAVIVGNASTGPPEPEVAPASLSAAPITRYETYDDILSYPAVRQDINFRAGIAATRGVLRIFDQQTATHNITPANTAQQPYMTDNDEKYCTNGEDCMCIGDNCGPNRLCRMQPRDPNDVAATSAATFAVPALTSINSALLQGMSTRLSDPNTDASALNLDDPDLLDWENEDYDFGEEPTDEAFDVWGCACNFNRLKKQDVDLEHWIQDIKYLECMKCFEGVELLDLPLGSNDMHDAEKRAVKKMKKERLAWNCMKCGVVVCGMCRDEKVRALKVGMKQNQEAIERLTGRLEQES